jgi:hypothetical protein
VICFQSVHAAVLSLPHRLARWLEGAVSLLPEEECSLIMRHLVYQLLQPHRPGGAASEEHIPVGEAPGKVPAEQWERGSQQLRCEVRACA